MSSLIRFTCPSCQSTVDAPAAAGGQGYPCPRCRELVTVPAIIGGPPPAPMQCQPHRAAMVLALAIGGGVVSVLGLCVFMILPGTGIERALGVLLMIGGCIPGVGAWLLGARDLAEMDALRMDPSGKSLTETGKVGGIVCTALAGIFLLMAMFTFSISSIGTSANNTFSRVGSAVTASGGR